MQQKIDFPKRNAMTQEDAAVRIKETLQACPGCMREKELVQMTGITGRTIRKIIVVHLRGELGLLILSGPKGYRWPRDGEDIEEHKRFFKRRVTTGLRNYMLISRKTVCEAAEEIRNEIIEEDKKKLEA